MNLKTKFALTAVGATPLGYLITEVPLDYAQPVGWATMAAGLTTVGVTAWTSAPGRRATAARLERWRRRNQRAQGIQSLRNHLTNTSARAIWWKKSKVVRPTLGSKPFLAWLRTPATEYAAALGKSGRRTLWLAMEDVVLRIAGARSGKTVAMACRIIDHPGSAVVTSTRTDLLRLTAPIRAQRATVHVFNPANIGGYASTLKWSPLVGCKYGPTAERRAESMLPVAATPDKEEWNDMARNALAPMLHAAALNDMTMRDVAGWIAATGVAAKDAGQQIDAILEDAPFADSFRENASQFFGMVGQNEKTRSSIMRTLLPAVGWLGNPTAAAIGDAPVADDMFDVERFFRDSETIYLLGEEDRKTAALTGALVSEIVFRAKQIAEGMKGGRLDPPLLLALDEAALVAPGPLHRWTADMGGRGVVLDIAVQSMAWLESVWGADNARIIIDNSRYVLLGRGCKNASDLAHWEALTGLRDEVAETKDADGKVTSTSTRKVPVITRDQLGSLPECTAVVFGLQGVLVIQTPIIHQRADAKRTIEKVGEWPKETRYAEQLITEGVPQAGEVAA